MKEAVFRVVTPKRRRLGITAESGWLQCSRPWPLHRVDRDVALRCHNTLHRVHVHRIMIIGVRHKGLKARNQTGSPKAMRTDAGRRAGDVLLILEDVQRLDDLTRLSLVFMCRRTS